MCVSNAILFCVFIKVDGAKFPSSKRLLSRWLTWCPLLEGGRPLIVEVKLHTCLLFESRKPSHVFTFFSYLSFICLLAIRRSLKT